MKRKKPGSVSKKPTLPETAPYRPTAAEQAVLDKHEARKVAASTASGAAARQHQTGKRARMKKQRPGSVPKKTTLPEKPQAPYQPTAAEQATLDKHEARKTTDSPAPRVLLVGREMGQIALNHPDQKVACKLLMDALGTTNTDFVNGIVRQLFEAGDKLDEDKFNFLLAVIKDGKPGDQLEAMLYAQMAVVHVSFMKFGQHFEKFETPMQQDSAVGALAKLGRTFAAQLEAAKRYRTGGQQKITVQHVTVQEGGQAIVGDVNQPAQANASPISARSTPALTDARHTAMPIIGDRQRAPVPLRRRQKDDARSSA